MGLKPKTKAGAVSHEIRIFFEALMALEPNQQQVDMMFRLGDLIHYLYPDGKFNRTNQLPYIINALEVLHFYATVPWRDDQGDLRRWRPVHVKQSEREPNPDAIKRYPVLSDEDLIYACFPNTTTQNHRVLLKRAQTHWTALEKAGIVRIERLTHRWRILPGASHIEKYRGVKETQKRG